MHFEKNATGETQSENRNLKISNMLKNIENINNTVK